jgi:hypothetical protein
MDKNFERGFEKVAIKSSTVVQAIKNRIAKVAPNEIGSTAKHLAPKDGSTLSGVVSQYEKLTGKSLSQGTNDMAFPVVGYKDQGEAKKQVSKLLNDHFAADRYPAAKKHFNEDRALGRHLAAQAQVRYPKSGKVLGYGNRADEAANNRVKQFLKSDLSENHLSGHPISKSEAAADRLARAQNKK